VDRRFDRTHRTELMNDVLANPDKYPDPGSIVDVLSPARADQTRDVQQQAAREPTRRAEDNARLEQAERELARDAAGLAPEERVKREIELSLSRQLRNEDHPDAVYFVEDDPTGAYANARAHRAKATAALAEMFDRQIGAVGNAGSGGQLLREFNLLNSVDDFMLMSSIEWSPTGDSAVGVLPEHMRDQKLWLPTLRKVGRDWKIDISDEIIGNAGNTAARAEKEAVAIEQVTKQIRTMKLKTYEQVRDALRAANVQGIGKALQSGG
jgi:hypothetical protein